MLLTRTRRAARIPIRTGLCSKDTATTAAVHLNSISKESGRSEILPPGQFPWSTRSLPRSNNGSSGGPPSSEYHSRRTEALLQMSDNLDLPGITFDSDHRHRRANL